MVKIMIDLPDHVNKNVSKYSIEFDFNDKRIAIIDILESYFKNKK